MSTAYIGLGSNLGDRFGTLQRAVRRIIRWGTIAVCSSVYETDPVGYVDQPRYLNAVVCLDTELAPEALLAALLEIEQEFGRIRSFHDAPRTLDLDLLLYDNLIMDSPNLTLPHPRLHERGFVLIPLAEIAPELVHPALGKTVATLRDELTDTNGIHEFGSLGLAPLLRRLPTSGRSAKTSPRDQTRRRNSR